ISTASRSACTASSAARAACWASSASCARFAVSRWAARAVRSTNRASLAARRSATAGSSGPGAARNFSSSAFFARAESSCASRRSGTIFLFIAVYLVACCPRDGPLARWSLHGSIETSAQAIFLNATRAALLQPPAGLAAKTGRISEPRHEQSSIYPRQDLLQVGKEPWPPVLGALAGLPLIRPETRLLHAQVGPRFRRGESPSDDTLETMGRPRVRQRFVRLDDKDLTVDSAPVCAKIETLAHDRIKVFFREPLLDQVWLRERA